MDEQLLELLKQIRIGVTENKLKDFSFDNITSNTGITEDELKVFFQNEEELIVKLLELERRKFEEIFARHDFEGWNAIDILLTVSKEVAKNFILVSPAITIHMKVKYPQIYQKHFDKRLEFIFDKIQINITKGINGGMYRDDLSIELLGRLYLSRLIDIHNPDLFPPEKFSFDTLFNVMFQDLIRSIGTAEGIKYFEKKIKQVKFEVN
jgi:hypothetical protein